MCAPGTAGDSAFFSADDQRKFAGLPGVRRVEFLRVQSVLVDPAQPRVALLARDLPADDPARALPLVGEATASARGRSAAGVGERSDGGSLRLPPGRQITLPLAGRDVAFTVAGVWRDYARQQGSVVIDRALYAHADRRHHGERCRAHPRCRVRASTTCGANSSARGRAAAHWHSRPRATSVPCRCAYSTARSR